MVVTVKTSLVKEFHETMRALIKKNVYVGIPADSKKRDSIETKKGDKPSRVTNAQLGYINEYGSPANNIPARPFLVPGVKESAPQVVNILKAAVITTQNSAENVDITLNKAGQKARDTVKRRIQQSTDMEPLSEVTKKIRATRKRNRRTGVMKPLIDTGQMLNSITYVVREN